MKLQFLTASLLLGHAATAVLNDASQLSNGVSSAVKSAEANSLQHNEELLHSQLTEEEKRYVTIPLFHSDGRHCHWCDFCESVTDVSFLRVYMLYKIKLLNSMRFLTGMLVFVSVYF